MILYRLRCKDAHEFEAWFRNADAYEEQAESGLLRCPNCGTAEVAKALMAPALRATGRRRPPAEQGASKQGVPEQTPTRQVSTDAVALKHQLLKLRRTVEANCDPVGERFAEEARKMHYGESDARGIYGNTTPDEAESLRDEGIEFGTMPWFREDA